MDERHSSPELPGSASAFYVRVGLETGTFPVREYPSLQTASFIAECLADRGAVQGALEAPRDFRTITGIEVYEVAKVATGGTVAERERVHLHYGRDGNGSLSLNAGPALAATGRQVAYTPTPAARAL